MAITFTYTCDLCGTEHPRGELRRLGLVAITEGGTAMKTPGIAGPPADVCSACRARPIADLIASLETRKAEHEAAERAKHVSQGPGWRALSPEQDTST